MLTTTAAFASGTHEHQVAPTHTHGAANDPNVGVNDLHHHHSDGTRHRLMVLAPSVCDDAVPYKGYGVAGTLYIKPNGTYFEVTRVDGGIVHTRLDEDCKVTSQITFGNDQPVTPTPVPTPAPTPTPTPEPTPEPTPTPETPDDKDDKDKSNASENNGKGGNDGNGGKDRDGSKNPRK